jgi:Glycosyltransferase family 25 (LPS biosynthesis protein)
MSATTIVRRDTESEADGRPPDARSDSMQQRIPVYVLSLARAAERRRAITTHLDRRAIAYEVLDGVDGRELSDEQVAELVLPEANLSRGMIGCNLSHIAAYRRLVESDRDVALVLEDDARLAADVPALLATDPDHTRFDFCLLDCLNRNYHVPVFYDLDERLTLGGGIHRLSPIGTAADSARLSHLPCRCREAHPQLLPDARGDRHLLAHDVSAAFLRRGGQAGGMGQRTQP